MPSSAPFGIQISSLFFFFLFWLLLLLLLCQINGRVSSRLLVWVSFSGLVKLSWEDDWLAVVPLWYHHKTPSTVLDCCTCHRHPQCGWISKFGGNIIKIDSQTPSRWWQQSHDFLPLCIWKCRWQNSSDNARAIQISPPRLLLLFRFYINYPF